jgi:hypothetical protein
LRKKKKEDHKNLQEVESIRLRKEAGTKGS